MKPFQELSFKYLRNDLPSALVVFLVALPLCLGIALASGAPLFSGVIAGIVGGIVVGFFSGSNLGVSGPAAGLTVIVLGAIQELEFFNVFLLAVVLAGVIQVILGFLKAGVIGHFIPASVIKGMLSAIGIIIFLKQIPHALGYDADPEGEMEFVQQDGHNTFTEVISAFQYPSTGAVIICLLSLLILIAWESKFIKRYSWSQIIQGPLIVVILGILINGFYMESMTEYALSGDHMVVLPVASTLNEFIDQFTRPQWGAISNMSVWIIAVTLALVGSLESLLSLEATDKLDPHERETHPSRELIAQGAGNIVSGIIGGLPVTQVIIRSSANIQSGGRTKMSTILHGLFLLLAVALIPQFLNKIPLASLAAVLLLVGYKLAKPSLFVEMFKKGWSQFIPFLITVVSIVLTDLLIGILIGLAVGIFFVLFNSYRRPYRVEVDFKHREEVKLILGEHISFFHKASLMMALKQLEPGTHLTIDASKTHSMDLDVLETLNDFVKKAGKNGLEIQTIHFPVQTMATRQKTYAEVKAEKLDSTQSKKQ